jgi:hypothetical protein
MPKITKLKATQNVAPKRSSTKTSKNDSNEEKPVITIVDKTDEECVDELQIKVKKGKKRNASSSPVKVRLLNLEKNIYRNTRRHFLLI